MTGPKKKHFAPEQLAQAAIEIVELAKAARVRVALAGGFAMQIYGSARLTGDVDFVADSWIAPLRKGKELTFGGNQTKTSNRVPVDLILRDDEYIDLYQSALDTAGRSSELNIPIVRPEFLLAIKIAALRPRDELDARYLIANKLADPKNSRVIIKKYLGEHAAREFDLFVAETMWRARTGNL